MRRVQQNKALEQERLLRSARLVTLGLAIERHKLEFCLWTAVFVRRCQREGADAAHAIESMSVDCKMTKTDVHDCILIGETILKRIANLPAAEQS
jgi:hypothetical protein